MKSRSTFHRTTRRTKLAGIVAIATVGAIALAGCSAGGDADTAAADGDKKPLIISLDSAADILDPQLWRTPGAMVSSGSLYEQLIEQTYETSGAAQLGTTEMQNALAETYEYSEDGAIGS